MRVYDAPVTVMIDGEFTGMSFARHSALAFALVAFRGASTVAGSVIASVTVNIAPQEGRVMDPATQREFFDAHPALLDALGRGADPAPRAMAQVAAFLARFRGPVTLVAKPAAVDVPWLRYMMDTYGPEGAPPVHLHRVLCLQTRLQTAQGMLGVDRGTFQRMLMAHRAHQGVRSSPTHLPLDDCMTQIADYIFVHGVMRKFAGPPGARAPRR